MGASSLRSLLLKTLSPSPAPSSHGFHSQTRSVAKVRLKWVKNRGLDHIIDTETDLKAACLLKDAIHRSSHGFLSSRFLSDKKKLLGLTVPVLRFLRRYPTLFHEFPHPQYSNLPCFKLTDTALLLHNQEQSIHDTHESDSVERLTRLLMMSQTRQIPFQALIPLKWDLGLPDNFIKDWIPKYPDRFRAVKRHDGLPCLSLARWDEELAVSQLQKNFEKGEPDDGIGSGFSHYRNFRKGGFLAFPMNFPRGYGAQKKVIAWMDEFQKLPYISPYEDSSEIEPQSDLMEKRVVGVLHEFLSLTIHKKTKRNYLRHLREELNLPHKFTRIFTRYPGIFYLSLKCKTTSVVLKEGYRRAKLVDAHPLARIREKFYYVMRTGVMYRGKGLQELIYAKDNIGDDKGDGVDQDSEEDDEMEDGDSEEIATDFDSESDEE